MRRLVAQWYWFRRSEGGMTAGEAEALTTARVTVRRMSELAKQSGCRERWSQAFPWERPEASRRSVLEDLRTMARRSRG